MCNVVFCFIYFAGVRLVSSAMLSWRLCGDRFECNCRWNQAQWLQTVSACCRKKEIICYGFCEYSSKIHNTTKQNTSKTIRLIGCERSRDELWCKCTVQRHVTETQRERPNIEAKVKRISQAKCGPFKSLIVGFNLWSTNENRKISVSIEKKRGKI